MNPLPLPALVLATAASDKATAVLGEHWDLATSVLAGQIRTTSVDLLMGAGMDPSSALKALEEDPAPDWDG